MQPQPRPPSPHPAPTQSEAVEMMDQIVRWVREDPSGLGRPQLPGALASESLAVPMMLLSLVEQLGEADEALAGSYAELGDWCAQRILRHVQVGSRRLTPGPDRAWAPGGRTTPTAQGASSTPTPPPTWALMGRHREARPGQGVAQAPQEGGGPRASGGAAGRRESARAPRTAESRKSGQTQTLPGLCGQPSSPDLSPPPVFHPSHFGGPRPKAGVRTHPGSWE